MCIFIYIYIYILNLLYFICTNVVEYLFVFSSIIS
jgi:hypothetical protein